jgi:hypothetical protein
MEPDNASCRKAKQRRQPMGIVAPQTKPNENGRICRQHRKGVGSDIDGLKDNNGMQTKDDDSDAGNIALENSRAARCRR